MDEYIKISLSEQIRVETVVRMKSQQSLSRQWDLLQDMQNRVLIVLSFENARTSDCIESNFSLCVFNKRNL